MSTGKIAISMNEQLLHQLDDLVFKEEFPSRSRAIQTAVSEMLKKKHSNRLAREYAKLNPEEEIVIAEEGMNSGLGTDQDSVGSANWQENHKNIARGTYFNSCWPE